MEFSTKLIKALNDFWSDSVNIMIYLCPIHQVLIYKLDQYKLQKIMNVYKQLEYTF